MHSVTPSNRSGAVGQRCDAHLAAQAVWLASISPMTTSRELTRRQAMSAALGPGRPRGLYFAAGTAGTGAFAISFRTVFDGCAPLLIHASTFARSICTVGGSVSGL